MPQHGPKGNPHGKPMDKKVKRPKPMGGKRKK